MAAAQETAAREEEVVARALAAGLQVRGALAPVPRRLGGARHPAQDDFAAAARVQFESVRPMPVSSARMCQGQHYSFDDDVCLMAPEIHSYMTRVCYALPEAEVEVIQRSPQPPPAQLQLKNSEWWLSSQVQVPVPPQLIAAPQDWLTLRWRRHQIGDAQRQALHQDRRRHDAPSARVHQHDAPSLRISVCPRASSSSASNATSKQSLLNLC